MRTLATLLLMSITPAVFSCHSSARKQATTQSDTLPPVETHPPNTDYKPAFTGQTRIPGIKTATAYDVKTLDSNLRAPWGITNLPDGRLIITEKMGTMRIATTAGKVSEPITGLPPVNPDGQGGLLGILADPGFATNRTLYWVFSQKLPEGNLTAVAKGKLSADETKIEGATVIYQATPAHPSTLHYGGRILMDRSGNLIVSTGERSDLDTRPQAQDLRSGLGKIVRITTDGRPAAGNPFEHNKDARPELYSYGHRNVQGLAFHPTTGDLWETEFGPRGGDELNRIEAGKNYGWPVITYGLEYSGEKVGGAIQQKEGLEQPVYYWDPVLSPSGITFYSGAGIAEWKNNLFICGLSSAHIARLVIENNKVVGEERLLAGERQRFRDITEGKDGALYVVTDMGKLFRISAKGK